MGNAIKFLKKEISCLPDTLREDEVSGFAEWQLHALGEGAEQGWMQTQNNVAVELKACY